MSTLFKDAVRNKKIVGPTDRNFDLEKWDKKWAELKSENKREHDIYVGGKLIDSLLTEIREELGNLYKKRPPSSKKMLIQSHVAISNRNRAIIVRPDIKDITAVNLHSLSTDRNQFGIDITYQEIAEQSIESITLAMKSLITNELNVASDCDDFDILQFVQAENYFSGLYRVYEDYWQALVWGEYELNQIDENNKIYEIKQIKNKSEVIYEITQARKLKLYEQSTFFLLNKNLDRYIGANEKYISISGAGKNKKISVCKVLNGGNRVKYLNMAHKNTIDFIKSHYPDGFMGSQYKDNAFTVEDAFRIFTQLIIFAESVMDRFPKNDSFFNIKKLSEFCPVFKKIELILSLSKSIDMRPEKVGKIIEFIIFKAQKNEDLWCHPIINVGGGEIVILVGALNGAVMQRVAEHWFVEFDINLTDKGIEYEKNIIESVSRSIESNSTLKNYDFPVSKRIKLGSHEEEIDFMMRIGNKIIVGEAKSIVVADSSISHFRTLDVIDGAIDQINRKIKFAENYIKEIFSLFNWKYDSSLSYIFIPVVFVSNRIHSGFPRSNVFVTDEILLSKYFSGTSIPLLSGANNDHAAWFDLYSNESEAYDNLERYLENPPQISMSEDDFQYKSIQVPCIQDDSIKIVFSRLVSKDISAIDLLNKPYKFPLKKADNVEEFISKIDFLM